MKSGVFRLNNKTNDSKKTVKSLDYILNSLDTMIFTAVPETGEILFINDLMRKHLNVDGSCIGQPCYNVFYEGLNERCSFCPCHELDRNPEKTVVWTERSTLTKRVYRNTDSYIEWTDGKKAHLQNSVDVTELSEAKEQAVQSSKAKSLFLSVMSRQMITPLNAIIGMAAIGINTESLERKTYTLKKIEDASRNLKSIINNVLDISMVETNKLELSNTAFDFNNLINEAVSLIKFGIDEKKLQFEMNIGENIPAFFIGDAGRLKQVISNLLSNAVKFTPEKGYIRFDISLAGEKNGLCELNFEVADNGIGISPEIHKKIFHAFEQAESSITGKIDRKGLSLIISRHIVELMNGRIWVKSEVGKGASFNFNIKLPRDLQEGNKDTVFESCRKPNDEKVSIEDIYNKFKGRNILVVEDVDSEIIVSLLDGSGLNIDTAVNGRDAVDLMIVSPEKYELIFMDIHMPLINGFEATRQIRTLNGAYYKEVPIIALTADIFPEDIEKCREAGMNDHIGKPYDIGKIFSVLNKFLT
jgi:signal transduction histidine kinase